MHSENICNDLTNNFRPNLLAIEEAEASIKLNKMFRKIQAQFDRDIVPFVNFVLTTAREYISCCNKFNTKTNEYYKKAQEIGRIDLYNILIAQWRFFLSDQFENMDGFVVFLKTHLIRLLEKFNRIKRISAVVVAVASTPTITNITCPIEAFESHANEVFH